MPLTEVQIKQAKPKEKRYMLRDDRGLYLEVQPNGNRHWRMRYWENGKERKISLGEYPMFSLKQARDKRDEMRLQRAQGIDPRAAQRKGLSFEAVATEWHEKQVVSKSSQKYAYKVMSILRRLIFPSIGNSDIQKVTAPDILMPLRAIEARGLNDTASTALQLCGQIFRYAVASGYAAGNPAADLRGALAPVIVKHNASLTDPRKIADLLRAMRSYSEIGSVVVHNALWFSAYTFLRPGEVRRLEWQEVNIGTREIRIPPEKMKMRRLHVVPLSSQVVNILEELTPITGRDKYVFPSIRSDGKPMSEATITVALRRMGFSSDEMSAHGFRSMASTTLYEQNWTPDAIERQLAHVEGNSVKAAYNYAEHLPERRKMMQAWADWLDQLR